MTNKHYEAVARLIHAARRLRDAGAKYDPLDTIQFGLAGMFEEDNPRFSLEKFVKACEYGEEM
jgi:hypothetical protein